MQQLRDKELPAASGLNDGEPLRLHIGGCVPREGWKILNAAAGPDVDYCQNAKDLSNFETESVEEIYASHVLEHFHYRLHNELANTINEWHRVLVTGGKLHISVPDMDVICQLWTARKEINDRRYLIKVFYGGQTDTFDCHHVGFNEKLLREALIRFRRVERVESFSLFRDTSETKLWNQPINLNVTAIK